LSGPKGRERIGPTQRTQIANAVSEIRSLARGV
jgi:hypothetical protein